MAGGVNLYAYAGSNPIAFRDPFGLFQDDPNASTGNRAWGAFKTAVNNAINATLSGLGDALKSAATHLLKEVGIQAALAVTTDGAGNAIRALKATDLAVDGLRAFEGTLEVAGSKATVSVSMVEGETSATSVVSALKGLARAEGASVLRVEGRIANEKLYSTLARRYGLRTEGGIDFFEIPIK